MKQPEYWNHNTAFFPWLGRQLVGCRSVLDVGCGDGALLACLDDGARNLPGARLRQGLYYRYLLSWVKA